MDMTPAGEQLRVAPAAMPCRPEWIDRFFGAEAVWCTASHEVAPDISAAAFERLVQAAYESVFDQLAALPALRPLRFWAFIPRIHAELGGGIDRYMVFNAGRHAAFTAALGPAVLSRGALPTASATGVTVDRFVLHCLASTAVPTLLENPRQVPAYRYSRRYGPVPPSFSRSALVDAPSGERLLLVAGTASILGEESQHGDDLAHQVRETLQNLASLIGAAEGRPAPLDDAGVRPLLGAFQDIRIYHPRLSDRAEILDRVRQDLSPRCRVEILQAPLCRAELMIEIEGVAVVQSHRT